MSAKKVYQFHRDMVAKHEAELQATGETRFLSAFLFRLFHVTERDTVERVLSKSCKEFEWYAIRHSHDSIHDHPSNVLRLIDAGRIDPVEVLARFDGMTTDRLQWMVNVDARPWPRQRRYGKVGKYTITRQDVVNLLDRNYDRNERMALAYLMSADCVIKAGLLSLFCVRKFNYIVRRKLPREAQASESESV